MVKRRRAKVLTAAMLATACGGVALTGSAGAESEPPQSAFPVHPLAITISPTVGHLSPSRALAGLFGTRIEQGPRSLDPHEATQLALEPLPGPFPGAPALNESEPRSENVTGSAPADGQTATPPSAEPAPTLPASATESEEPKPSEIEPAPPQPAVSVDNGTGGSSSTSGGTGPSDDALARLRACESGGDYTIVSYGGWYRGAYQFDQETWDSVTSRWRPALVGVDPAQASPSDQDAMARALHAERGWAPWPACGIGL